jgi:cytochrome P450
LYALFYKGVSVWCREDLNQLKYTTMVVKEALRLHCPVPMIQRELTKDMTISGVTLPPGCHVDIAIYNLHHNPLVWTDPMVRDIYNVLW